MSDARLSGKSRKDRAIAMLEHWFQETLSSVVVSEHPLVTVQELHMTEASSGSMHATQKRSGKSRPPIRDMDSAATRFEHIMRHVGEVDLSWRLALEAVAEHETVRAAAAARRIKDSQLYRDFNLGLAVIQSEMIRRGM